MKRVDSNKLASLITQMMSGIASVVQMVAFLHPADILVLNARSAGGTERKNSASASLLFRHPAGVQRKAKCPIMLRVQG